MKKRYRTPNPELVKAHDEAWRALKALPGSQEIEKLFDILGELQLWHSNETLAQHTARYEAGKPEEIWKKINELRAEQYKTPESIRWFELYQKLHG